jgi:8-oxo-dGTP pyrophosphatase MutT (NUDIX family)
VSRASGVLAAMKAVPGGARHTPAPQSGGFGAISPVAANALYGNPYSQSGYGPFLPRPSRTFTDGAFGPMSPIQPVPVDEPAVPGGFPDPRRWQYPVGWNLPTQPRSEGLSLASFQQLYTLASKYSVARQCIELRKEEIRGLEWSIELTTKAAKAYQGDHKAMRDFGERAAQATKFFKHPDPEYWNFSSFLDALLEEIFTFDALSLIFRPKYGRGLGRGLLGSDLDSLNLISGTTVRPLLNMLGGKPRPPAPAYQQFLYGVPRSDYQTIISGADIDDYGLTGAQVNEFRADILLYAPLVPRVETPYGFPPVERALLPIISGLQKQEFQLDYFTEGTIPAVYISPGDPNMTPTQIRELQDALNGIAGDPAYHLKVVVLPPGSKTMPQRDVDLSDGFDLLVQTQVAMAFDVMPTELGILPNVGGAGAGGSSSSSAIRFGAAEARDLKTRKSTKPLLMFLCDIFNYVLQDICGQADMQFSFEGLVDDEDKQQITELGVQQVQNGIASIDEVRERLDMAPWGLEETSEPVVFTAQGPIPFSMAPQLIAAMQGGGAGAQGTNSNQRTPSSRSRTSQPSVRAGGQTKPNGSHQKPLAPHRESLTPAHSAAAGAIQSPGPRTGGTPSRSPVAGSRKRGESATGRATHHKAVTSELDALRRHLRKGRLISTWVAEHIPERALSAISEDLAKGVLIDTAVERAGSIVLADDGGDGPVWAGKEIQGEVQEPHVLKDAHWPGWERDLGLVGAYKNLIGQAFHDAETRGSDLRKKAATGVMFVSNGVLRGLISDEVKEVFADVLTPLWTEAWHLGYAAAKSLVTGEPADFTAKQDSAALQGFIGTEGEHWLEGIARTGLGNNSARSELIARTEVGRAIASAAIQCYRDHGVTHKHLLTSPGACDMCKDAAEDGDIPLDAPFSAGGVTGQVHPGDRCVPGPSWIDVEPPLADLGKASGAVEDTSRAAFLMMRARHPDDGKWRYLLQKRPDGGWGLPGGSTHYGEEPHAAAIRESTEEIGDLPPLGAPRAVLEHRSDDRTVWVHLHEVPFFQPRNNGSTPEETAGTGWFRRGEVGDLDLHPPFRRQWENTDWKHVGKALQRMVNENGEVLTLTPASQALQAVGSRWPYPKRSDGSEWPDAGPGSVPDGHGSAGGEPPHWADDMTGPEPHDTLEPRGGDDGQMPSHGRMPNPPAAAFPNQGSQHDDAWPQPQATLTPAPASPVGADTGVPPSGASKGDSAHPVVGSVPAQAPRPFKPGSVPPVAFDPGETTERWSDADDSDVVTDLPKGAAQVTDANPVEWRHVWSVMESQFPDSALQWVRHSTWHGPTHVPWSRIDDDAIDSWAASHQPEAVNRFAREIAKGGKHTEPSILIHQANSPDGREKIVDGHHRAMARHFKLGMPVLAYVGTVPARWMQQALETHSSQFHQGSDPGNR